MSKNSKIVYGRLPIKWTSWKGNDMFLKVDQMHSLLRKLKKISLTMIIDQQIKQMDLNKIINRFYFSLSIRLLLR